MKVGDIRVLVRCGKKGQVALEVKKKSSIVDLWDSSPANQDRAALLWSTSDETDLQSLIKNDIFRDIIFNKRLKICLFRCRPKNSSSILIGR